MVVAEIFLAAFNTVISEKLATADLMKLARSEGIHSQLKKWSSMLSLIRAVLVDAGQKQITDKAVQLWQDDLQDLAYDIDDVLDDMATEALRRRLTDESPASSSSKVQKLIPACCTSFTPHNFMYGRKMSSKLDEITARLNELLEMKKGLGLNENVEKPIKSNNRRLETSLVESGVVGREGDKEKLLKRLLENETCNGNVNIVPIVGLGGIGKTTLARLLYNEKKVKDHFELKAWVCVSDEFDVFKISMIIFQALTEESKDFKDLNLLQVALQDKFSNKRFLLVLDDIWNEDGESWERLQRPFQAGAPGSKIIVTTRSNKVVSAMGVFQSYPLNVLSNEESLSLFAQQALGETNFDAHPTIKSQGEGIVRKCDGLPLALKTLGKALRTKVDVEDWEELLNSDLWTSNEDASNVVPALRLSYHYLPPHLKQLFAYCSLFPKDYAFNKDELVLLWMAERFLHVTTGKRPVERVGSEYFEELLSRSFFQHSPNEESRYIMHDLMNELATSVAGQFFCRLDDDDKNAHERNEALDKFHHFSFIRQGYGVYRKFKAFQRAKRLRTFLSMSVREETLSSFYLSNKVLTELLPQLQFLRVLSLRSCLIKEVPDSIGNLKHLRYLNFSYTDITCVPEEVGDLYNLQTLLLCGCRRLTKLPNNFAKLINLRHLDITETPSLEKMPLGIGGLTSLQTLSKVIIEETYRFRINDLRGLSNLRGRIFIKGLDMVKNASLAKEANLVERKSLDDLEMEWSDVFDDSRRETIEYRVFEALRPHHNLKTLNIRFYGGIKFPTWIGDPSFIGLTELTLRSCRSCTSLPPLGDLPLLRKLFVEGMDGVKTIGCEFLGTGNSVAAVAFPSLEILEFTDMNSWEIWSTISNNNDEVFPCLRELRIRQCPKLVEVSIQSISSVQDLVIDGCSEVVLRSLVRVAPSINKLSIDNIGGLTQLQGGVIEFLRGVEELLIYDCKELRHLWESEAEACEILVNLRKLSVLHCDELIRLEEKEENNQGSSLASLRELHLLFCPRLEYFSQESIFSCLETLQIWYCSAMKWFPTGKKKLPSTLKNLRIVDCETLLESGGGGENSSPLLNSMSSIESIAISVWPNFKSLPEFGCFAHLTRLSIYGCDGIECFPKQGDFFPQRLRYLYIDSCKNLKSFPDDKLQSLPSLVELTIVNCPSMDSAIPRGLWPPNLGRLMIGGLKKPIRQWGPQNFPTSLVDLELHKESSLVSTAEMEECIVGNSSSSSNVLPSSLTVLEIIACPELKSLSKGLQHLTSLEQLKIYDCPKLRDLPETLLPELSELYINNCPKLRDLPETLLPELSILDISNCPELKERCSRRSNRRDSYWPLISHIPRLEIW